MKSATFWLSQAAIVAVPFFPHAFSQICSPEPAYSFDISTQEELDNLSKRCTTLNESAYFYTNYTESFVLSNITHAQRYLTFYPSDIVSSLELPDLEYVESLEINGVRGPGRVSAPRVRSIKHLYLRTYAPETSLDFPLLEHVESLTLHGNWSSTAFDSLHTIDGGLSACQGEYCRGSGPDQPPMSLSFPALEHVNDSIRIGGNIAMFSTPKLATLPIDSSINIWNIGSVLNLSFPALSSAPSSVSLQGNIASMEMPTLRDKLPALLFSTYAPLSLTLLGQQINSLTIHVPRIESLRLPNLLNFSSISISSDEPFDCGGFENEIMQKTDGVADDEASFHCDAPSVSGGLSTGAKAGIGVSVGMAGVALIGLLVYFLWRRRAKGVQKTPSGIKVSAKR
ncbi:hypothetical protein BDW62DRAFT_205346 [Aspergillus aurantiobrunneus]